MGKKVSPHSLRIGITRTWDSNWFSSLRTFKDKLLQDVQIRKLLEKRYASAGVAKVEIQRRSGKTIVTLHTAKPGVIIGRSGENIEKLSKELREKFETKELEVKVQEVRKPDADATLMAKSIADQIQRRFPYRRVCKMAVDRAKDSGAKGVKIQVSGRLNGVDIARKESYGFGTVPLHTLRANIDYAMIKADTTYGAIGIKVWVYHGMVFKNQELN